MKVICIKPKESAGLFFMHTYTKYGEHVCQQCGHRWFFIEEAAHTEPTPRALLLLISCRYCGGDLPYVNLDTERHMFNSDRFMGLPIPGKLEELDCPVIEPQSA